MTTNWTLEHNIEKAPGYLLAFIKNFFKREFIFTSIYLGDLEVNRIDICFNQIFKTKEDALLYFNYQKKLKKKHSREEDGGQTDYNTSFMYKTARSSSKIYHKGTEYKKHDLREHLKINDEKGVQYFDTKKFQELADRMLRYEVTIRSAEMNYLFKHNIFRKDCPLFKIDYKNYLRIDSIKQRNNRISKTIGSLPDDEKEAYRKYHPYERISKEDRNTHKYVSQLLQRKPYFMMQIDRRDEIYNLETVNYDSKDALFSEALIKLCLKKLLDFMNEYKIRELPNEERVNLLLDEYNKTHKAKIQKSDMVQFYNLLVKYGSFKEAAKFSRYSRATLYRYKDRFKKIGITERNVQPDKSYSIPQAANDFREYHSFLDKTGLLRKLNIR
jgi:hypothetical protein